MNKTEKLASYGLMPEDIAEYLKITVDDLFKEELLAGYSEAKKFKNPLFGAYKAQRGRASDRGIEWEFNFPLWLGKWLGSDKISQRGRKGHQYVMARKGDTGPYSFDNTVIITSAQNHADAHSNGVCQR